LPLFDAVRVRRNCPEWEGQLGAHGQPLKAGSQALHRVAGPALAAARLRAFRHRSGVLGRRRPAQWAELALRGPLGALRVVRKAGTLVLGRVTSRAFHHGLHPLCAEGSRGDLSNAAAP
ncbi:unnamed protein product, partial [Durusdinium trenchii]